MQLPDRDHPIWKVIPALLAVIVLALMMGFNYANGFDPKRDTETIVAAIVAYLAGQGGKLFASAPKSDGGG